MIYGQIGLGKLHIETVIHTKAGIQIGRRLWIPVFTGMTIGKLLGICDSSSGLAARDFAPCR